MLINPTGADDTVLAREATAGNERAAAELYRRHFPAAVRAARTIAQCEADAADAAQEALLATLDRLPALDPGTLCFGSYVHVSARRAAMKIVNRASRHAELQDDGPAAYRVAVAGAVPEASPCERVEQDETVAQVRGALAALPDRQRVALFRAAFEERSATEIGDELDLTANGVNQLLFRARRSLARELAA